MNTYIWQIDPWSTLAAVCFGAALMSLAYEIALDVAEALRQYDQQITPSAAPADRPGPCSCGRREPFPAGGPRTP